jgi:putative membrane protein
MRYVRVTISSPNQMIKNFSNRSANERTFLAWVRTSIAVIAFGFLVERFDLFLAFAAPEALKNKMAVPPNEFGHVASLVPIVLGISMILVAAVRFARDARERDNPKTFPGTGSRVDLALAALLNNAGGRTAILSFRLTYRASMTYCGPILGSQPFMRRRPKVPPRECSFGETLSGLAVVSSGYRAHEMPWRIEWPASGLLP